MLLANAPLPDNTVKVAKFAGYGYSTLGFSNLGQATRNRSG